LPGFLRCFDESFSRRRMLRHRQECRPSRRLLAHLEQASAVTAARFKRPQKPPFQGRSIGRPSRRRHGPRT
jgi:hypothetical protein